MVPGHSDLLCVVESLLPAMQANPFFYNNEF
jgi:hypothetical protein